MHDIRGRLHFRRLRKIPLLTPQVGSADARGVPVVAERAKTEGNGHSELLGSRVMHSCRNPFFNPEFFPFTPVLAINHPAAAAGAHPALRLAHVHGAEAHRETARARHIDDIPPSPLNQLFLDLDAGCGRTSTRRVSLRT